MGVLRSDPLQAALSQRPVNAEKDRGHGNANTSKSWKKLTTSGSVGSQLVMRAAANLPGAGGGGGLPPGGGLLSGLRGGGKKKKKKKKKKDKKKKKRKHGSAFPGGGSSGGGGSGGSSSSSSTSSESSGSSSSDASADLPPLRRKAERKPGSVLKLLLQQVESQLSELQGADGHDAALLGGTKILTYFHLLVKGNNGVQIGSRDGRELYLISVLLDLLRSGQLERLADGLSARFLALQTACMDGNWVAARHLEIFTPDQSTPGGPGVTLAARKHAKVLEKVKGHDSRSEQYRGGGWNRNAAWQWPRQEENNPSEGGKGKFKKGKGAKGKGGAWSGKGSYSWKGSEHKGGEKEKATDKPQNEQK